MPSAGGACRGSGSSSQGALHTAPPGLGPPCHTQGHECILPAHPQRFQGGAIAYPTRGRQSHGAPGFHSAVEASRGNNSLIPFLNQGQETTCGVSHRWLLPLPGCPCPDLLLLRSHERGGALDGDPVLTDPQSGLPHLLRSALIFNPQTLEFQSKPRPRASPTQPESGQNIKLSVSLLIFIQQHCSLPVFICNKSFP